MRSKILRTLYHFTISFLSFFIDCDFHGKLSLIFFLLSTILNNSAIEKVTFVGICPWNAVALTARDAIHNAHNSILPTQVALNQVVATHIHPYFYQSFLLNPSLISPASLLSSLSHSRAGFMRYDTLQMSRTNCWSTETRFWTKRYLKVVVVIELFYVVIVVAVLIIAGNNNNNIVNIQTIAL